MKYRLTIEYDGTYFIGWQKQNNKLSIQQTIEEAIKSSTGESVKVQGSSRTDAGVHATHQVAHFSLQRAFSCYKIKHALNFHLCKLPISIIGVEEASENFHARFSSTKRYYKYKIINRDSKLSLEKNRAWCVFRKLDVEKMRNSARLLVGTHDFTSFRSSECQAKNPVRTIDSINIVKIENLIEINVVARSFLHSQVRIIIGTLKEIGEGKKIDIKKILAAKDRRKAGITAPAYGLYLTKVVTPTGLEPVLPP
ncbi:MAG: tRNA pseudouridine(38-40) synthase TruA [Rickettsiaceae bacterium H1]|nr:tRNA pseudouridine(38-40) synthase TruA [Rickettsiaceae bacterium H1]